MCCGPRQGSQGAPKKPAFCPAGPKVPHLPRGTKPSPGHLPGEGVVRHCYDLCLNVLSPQALCGYRGGTLEGGWA